MFCKRTQTSNFSLAYTKGHLPFIALHSTSLLRYRIKNLRYTLLTPLLAWTVLSTSSFAEASCARSAAWVFVPKWCSSLGPVVCAWRSSALDYIDTAGIRPAAGCGCVGGGTGLAIV